MMPSTYFDRYFAASALLAGMPSITSSGSLISSRSGISKLLLVPRQEDGSLELRRVRVHHLPQRDTVHLSHLENLSLPTFRPHQDQVGPIAGHLGYVARGQ